MKFWSASLILVAALAAAATGLPALGQDAPESLLPPGFGTPDQPPPAAAPQAPAVPVQVVPPPPPMLVPEEAAAAEEASEAEPLPAPVSRPIDIAGFLPADAGGYGEGAFAGADGGFLVGLMRRIDAPLPSRWASIVLRRALTSRVATPRGVRPADWVAERAWLLVRMGDSVGAQLLIGGIGVDRYSPRLYDVAAQVALASGDIGLVCPLAETGVSISKEPFWSVARAICAGLGGESSLAAALLDRVRDRKLLGKVDLALAQRVASAGAGGRRGSNVQWTGTERLTIFRYGMATAAGVPIPEDVLAAAPPRLWSWRASANDLALEARVPAARIAAILGAGSSADLVDLYSAWGEATDSAGLTDSPAGRLRTAYVAPDDGDRIDAMAALWDEDAAGGRYAAHILTARAAARIAPSADHLDQAPALIASMLSAGLDRQALRWWPVLAGGNDAAALSGWALLAAGAPGRAVPVDADRLARWAKQLPEGANSHRARLLLAALVGLGRLDMDTAVGLGDSFGIDPRATNPYLARLDQAAADGRAGEVALLAAIGLQTGGWAGVPPLHLLHIVSALRRVGLEPEARMIAAEAVSRT